MKAKMIKVPIAAYFNGDGSVEYEYAEVPVSVYEQWLKKCFEQLGKY